MADVKTNKAVEDMEEVLLPYDPDPNAPQEEFYSYNFKNYLIQRGVKVKVPAGLKAIIDEQQENERLAREYTRDHLLREDK